MSEKKIRYIEDYTVSDYKCGLKAGNFLRLKKDIAVQNYEGEPTGEVHHQGEIWKILFGALEDPGVVWLKQPDGRRHTWDDDNSIFDAFEKMDEEIFDRVNDRDEVIGRETRANVHRLGLKHRAVHVLVFNRRGEVFLQKRSMQKDTSPGKWDSSASGHVDSGENYDTCAVRELSEEIGLRTDRAPMRLFKLDACPETGQEFVWVYRLEAEGPFTLHPEEIETGGWLAPDALTRWMADRPQDFAHALLLIWKLYNSPSNRNVTI